jgi:branched-chain amino acid transport system permease protein
LHSARSIELTLMELLCGLVSMSQQTLFMVDTAMYFGMVAIVALSLGFMYRRAGVPFLGCSVPVMVGGLSVSAVATRLAFVAAGAAGVELLPYASDSDWVYNNEQNVALVNEFLESRPLLCLGFIAFILVASVALGAASGWLISKPAIRLGPVYIMIVTLTLTDLAAVLGRFVVPLSGGTLGVYVPDFLAFYRGEKSFAVLDLVLLMLLGVFLALRHVEDSPLGMLMEAVRDDEVAAASLGKDVVRVRETAVMIGSGLMALSGALYSFYRLFVVQAGFSNRQWSLWPLLMIIIGGGGGVGALLGVASVEALRRAIILYKYRIIEAIFFPIAYLETMLLSLLLLVFLFLRLRLSRGVFSESPWASAHGERDTQPTCRYISADKRLGGGFEGGRGVPEGEEHGAGL